MAEQDIEYWKTEAHKAFQACDELKEKVRGLEGRTLTDAEKAEYAELKQKRAKLEEDALKAAGKFDELKAQIEATHQTALQAEKERAERALAVRDGALIDAAFGGAIELFGGQTARTIFDPDMARRVLGDRVKVVEETGKAPRVIVVDGDGHEIKAKSFVEAMGKAIDGMPNKDRILRGGGRPGSGSPGPGGKTQLDTVVDLSDPGKLDYSDPTVRQAIRDSRKGGITHGRAFDRMRRGTAKS